MSILEGADGKTVYSSCNCLRSFGMRKSRTGRTSWRCLISAEGGASKQRLTRRRTDPNVSNEDIVH